MDVFDFGRLPVVAQNPQPTMHCNEGEQDGGGRARFCEIREQTAGYGGQLTIDGGQNGGVTVKGWDRADVLVRSKVQAQADSEAEARSRASQVRVNASAGHIAAEGPSDGNWSVSYEVFAPKNASVQISTHNGGVGVSDISGSVSFFGSQRRCASDARQRPRPGQDAEWRFAY